MIFTKISKSPGQAETQSGASLMLAVLVLAAVTAIAFSLATIVFIEIRSAGDSVRTEPALYATFGVTEEALFQYKRFYTPSGAGDFNVPTCDGPAGSNVCLIGGVSLNLPGEQPMVFDNSPRVEFVQAGGTKTIPLYLPNDFDQQYLSVEIEPFPNQTSSSIDAHFVRTNSDGSTSSTVTVPVSPGSPYKYDQFLSTGQYELVLENTNLTQDLSVKIATVRVGNIVPDGLPFVGEQVLRIVADYLGLTRIYQVRIPIP